MPANRPLCESHNGAETIASKTWVSDSVAPGEVVPPFHKYDP